MRADPKGAGDVIIGSERVCPKKFLSWGLIGLPPIRPLCHWSRDLFKEDELFNFGQFSLKLRITVCSCERLESFYD